MLVDELELIVVTHNSFRISKLLVNGPPHKQPVRANDQKPLIDYSKVPTWRFNDLMNFTGLWFQALDQLSYDQVTIKLYTKCTFLATLIFFHLMGSR